MNFLLIGISLWSVSALEPKVVEDSGIIREVQCNNPSGLGVLFLEKRQNKTLLRRALKVYSVEWCGARPGEVSKLSAIALEAVLGKPSKYKVFLVGGYVTKIRAIKEIDYSKFMKGIERFSSEAEHDVMEWFLRGPARLSFDSQNLDLLIQRYTRF